jgi:hypothetical protein
MTCDGITCHSFEKTTQMPRFSAARRAPSAQRVIATPPATLTNARRHVYARAFRRDPHRGHARADRRTPARHVGDADVRRTDREPHPLRDRRAQRRAATRRAPRPRRAREHRLARLLPRTRRPRDLPGPASLHHARLVCGDEARARQSRADLELLRRARPRTGPRLRRSRLAARPGHEANQPHPWQLSDAPADFIEQQLAGIVGIEIPLRRLEGKWKVSQNRPARDRAGVVEGLRGAGNSAAAAMAEWVRERGS